MNAPLRPRRILPAIVFSQFAGTSLWFSGNAILPDLEGALGLGSASLAGITSAVQLGFIVGTLVFAILNVADRWRARDVFLACAVLGAVANAAILALPGVPEPYPWLLALRFATGFFLAGIYPVGMKIAASWFRADLGLALGWLVGALIVGTALPHLLKGTGLAGHWSALTLGVSGLAVAGGLVMHRLVPEGPWLGPASRFDPLAALRAWRSPAFRASVSGYIGHTWEVYALWTFAPVMLAAYASMHQVPLDVPWWSFWVIAAGALGCVGGGWVSRRTGQARVAAVCLGVSTLCCLVSPLAYLASPPLFLAFMLVWGVTVAGDSPQFSTLNAQSAPSSYVGSALTLANCIGFAASVAGLQLIEAIAPQVPVQDWFLYVLPAPLLGLVILLRWMGQPRAGKGPA